MMMPSGRGLRAAAYSPRQALAAAVGVPVALLVGMIAVSSPQIVVGIVLGSVAVIVARRLRSRLDDERTPRGENALSGDTPNDGSEVVWAD